MGIDTWDHQFRRLVAGEDLWYGGTDIEPVDEVRERMGKLLSGELTD